MRKTLLAILWMACTLRAQEPAKQGQAGTVKGTVQLNAKVRPPKNLPVDAQCLALHGGPLKTEETVLDPNQNMKWVFVWISKGLEGKEYPVPPEKVVLDQVGCCYQPHVLGLQAGQTLLIRNADATLHNVHGLPFANKEWNFAQPQKGQENEVKLLQPEMMVKVKCDIHSWMGAWVGVLSHPFFAVTDDSGRFSIPGLPPGKYTLSCWQEAWTTKADKGCEQEFEIKAGETKTLNFTLDQKKGE